MKPTPTSAPTLIETYTLSNSTVVEIPKDDITEPISLTLDQPCDSIQDLAVTVSIEHPQVGHLSIKLFSPDGKNATLMDRPSGDSDKSSGDKSDLSKLNPLTFFDSSESKDPDTIGVDVGTSEDVPQDTFYSVGNGAKDEFGVTLVGNPNSLSGFKGNNGEGTWTLGVSNNGKKTGTIHSVELTVECAIAAPPPVCSFCPDGLDNPDFELPSEDDMPSTCQDASDVAATLTSTDPLCVETFQLIAEQYCCPPVTTTQATITTPETTTDATTTAIATTQAPSCIVATREAAEGCVQNKVNDFNGCGSSRIDVDDIEPDGTTYCGSLSTFTGRDVDSGVLSSRDVDYFIFSVPRGQIEFRLQLTGDLFKANFEMRKLADADEPCGVIDNTGFSNGFGSSTEDTREALFFVDNLKVDSISGMSKYRVRVFPDDESGLECGTEKTYSYQFSVKFTPFDQLVYSHVKYCDIGGIVYR